MSTTDSSLAPAPPRPTALESLATKVRVAMIAETLPGIATSNAWGRWGEKNFFKWLSPAECRELAAILVLAAERAEKAMAEWKGAPHA